MSAGAASVASWASEKQRGDEAAGHWVSYGGFRSHGGSSSDHLFEMILFQGCSWIVHYHPATGVPRFMETSI